MRKGKLAFAMVLSLLAVGVMGASSASAASFTSSSQETTLTGIETERNIFTADTGKVECEEVHFTGSAVGKTLSSVTITPAYDDCTAFGFEADVTMNGCDYLIHASGLVDLECPAGKDVVIETVFSACNVTVEQQTDLSKLTFATDLTSGKHSIEVISDINNIKYKESGFACAASGKSTTGGSLDGKVTVTGRDKISGLLADLTHHP